MAAGPSQRPLRLLSLDGGGVRGLSTLIILKHIMSGVNASCGDDEPELQPWQVFDMIGGTSTGGLIAIMLGRLRMSIDECELAYLNLSMRIFKKGFFGKATRAADYLQANGRFDSKKLEDVIKECIRAKVDDENSLLKDSDPRCKVFVCAARANNTEPALLRSYHNPKMAEVLFNECRIWEACRATSAATTFFDPISIGRYGQTFVDGAVLYNNPVQLVQREASQIWPGRKAMIVSIGTGAAPSRSFDGGLAQIVKTMKTIITQTERTANDFYHANQDMVADQRLYRFNVLRGLEGVGLEEYKEIGTVADATQTYLDHGETSEKLGRCIERLSEKSGEGQADPDFLAILAQQNLEAERRAFSEWLSPLNFFVKQADVLSLRVDGTGQWLLESDHFKRWISGEQKTLWCSGIPGAGKTVLASIVIDHLQKTFTDDGMGIAFAYCSHQERIQQTPVNLVGSLLKQLAQDRPSLCDALQPFYASHRRRGTTPTLSEASKALQAVILIHYETVFIVIDALDECPEHNGFRDKLLWELGRLAQSPQVRLLVTSRPHITIAYDIEGAVPLDIQADQEDLRKYLQERLARAHRLVRYVRPDEKLRKSIVDTVLGNANGMFLLAQLHMDLIATKATQNEVRKALENLPRGLDESYRDALKRIESQNHDDCERAKRTLHWISHALRPLTVAELQAALAVMPGGTRLDQGDMVHQDILLSICAGLVVIDPESNVFRLVHFSAQKYFEGVRADIFPNAQLDIAGTCLTYVSFDVFASGPCAEDEQLVERVSQNPLLTYAGKNWGNHLRGKPEEDPRVRKLALQLLADGEKLASLAQVNSTASLVETNKKSKIERKGWSQEFPTSVGPLQISAGFGLVSITKFLVIEQDEDVRAKDSEGRTALHEAARVGSDELVSFLVQQGAEVSAQTTGGTTALAHAIVGGHESTAVLLVDHGSNLEAIDPYEGTVLHTAAYNGDLGAMRLLLSRGADIKALDSHANTALHVASHFGHEAMLELLLGTGGLDEVASNQNKYGCSPLHYAAYGGFDAIAARLLEKGADVHSKDKRGATPLHFAANSGNLAIARTLLERGADLHAMAEAGWFASSSDQSDDPDDFGGIVASFLWDEAQGDFLRGIPAEMKDMRRTNSGMAGSGPNVQNMIEGSAFMLPTISYGGTPVNRAAFKGKADVLRLLLEKGGDANSIDALGAPAIWRAASGGHDAAVEVLLEYGADVDAKDTDGSGHYGTWIPDTCDPQQSPSVKGTALSRAVYNYHPSTVRLLLEKGADPELRDSKKATSLHLAASSSLTDEECLKPLLKHKADLHARDFRGATPLLRAVFAREPGKVRLLVEAGADAKAVTRDTGSTLLHMVVESDEREASHCSYNYKGPDCMHCSSGKAVVELLVQELGQDTEAVDKDGLTPLALAIRNKYANIAAVLLANGANVNAKDGEGASILHQVVEEDLEEMVPILVEHGVDLDATDKDATDEGAADENAADKEVVDEDAVNEDTAREDIPDKGGVTALYWAVRDKKLEMVRLLVEAGANVNPTSAKWVSPAQMAVEDNQGEILRVLLQSRRGMDQDVLDQALNHAIAEGSEIYVVLLLEAGAGKQNEQKEQEDSHPSEEDSRSDVIFGKYAIVTPDGEPVPDPSDAVLSPVATAVLNNRPTILHLLLSHGFSFPGSEDVGMLLCESVLTPTENNEAGNGSADFSMATLLLDELGVDINTPDTTYGCTALHNAAAQGNEAAARFLLGRGADARAEQRSEVEGETGGPTALFWAASNGHAGVVGVLLGAWNPYKEEPLKQPLPRTGRFGDSDDDRHGDGEEDSAEWALHAAATHNHVDVVRVLVEQGGADVEAKFDCRDGAGGATALYWAAKAGCVGAVRVLLELGADVGRAVDMNGVGAVEAAEGEGWAEVVRVLMGRDLEGRGEGEGEGQGEEQKGEEQEGEEGGGVDGDGQNSTQRS